MRRTVRKRNRSSRRTRSRRGSGLEPAQLAALDAAAAQVGVILPDDILGKIKHQAFAEDIATAATTAHGRRDAEYAQYQVKAEAVEAAKAYNRAQQRAAQERAGFNPDDLNVPLQIARQRAIRANPVPRWLAGGHRKKSNKRKSRKHKKSRQRSRKSKHSRDKHPLLKRGRQIHRTMRKYPVLRFGIGTAVRYMI